MLKARDIQIIAGKNKVNDTQIEKDYVINWLLWGISQIELLNNSLVFKGGTVLKMVYFANYRFSEDLDFTLVPDTISNEKLIDSFNEAINAIEEESGIQLKLSPLEVHISGSIAFYIYFLGPLGGKIDSKSVKVDITRGEKLLYPSLDHPIFKNYSDLPQNQFLLRCYPLEEIMIEKLVALMGRTQPRDLYDIWYLLEETELDLELLKLEFVAKAQHKGHQATQFLTTWKRKSKQFENLWNQYLNHQIADLPKFEGISRAVNRHFKTFGQL
jgi:uncharacterized protein